jgi:hypothetical protein
MGSRVGQVLRNDAGPSDSLRSPLDHALQIVTSVGVGFGLSLPFIGVSGTVRSAYGLVRSARNLEVVSGPLKTLLAVTVVSVPMLVGALVMCVGLNRSRLISVLGFTIGVLGIATSIASLLVSSPHQIGSIVTLSSGVVLVLTTIGTAASQRRVRTRLTKRLETENGIMGMGGTITGR